MIAGAQSATMLQSRTIPICAVAALRLSDLPHRAAAYVVAVVDAVPNDAVARRLRDIGFVDGERVEVVAKGPVGAEPLLVHVGFTRFALRRSEAARVRVRAETAVEPAPAHPQPARAAAVA
jgi:ferrous iron transport protein A